MIDNLHISFEENGLTLNISVPTKDDNLPYNLAEAFIKVIDSSNANINITLEQLIDNYGYTREE